MSLAEKWKSFVKRHLDAMMEAAQADSEISYAEWQELKAEYKKTLGEDYERGQKVPKSQVR